LFTIIVPTHERPLLLQRTLQSLIAQTYRDFVVIIVSDSSAHIPPYKELLALQGRYVYALRSGLPGPAASRNMGLALTTSRYVMFLDDDDTLEPNHFELLAKHIGDDDPELLFCDFKVCYEDRTGDVPQIQSIQTVSIADVTQNSVYVRNRIPNSCVLYRHDVVTNIQHVTDLIIYEDWDFLLACLKGRSLSHVATDSVIIHKSPATAPENMRRGNTRDDLIAPTMLALYKKHPAPDLETRRARQELMASAGVRLDLENC
jgi:glycosyltransferase involved in cell wall biosynthesis